MKANKVHVGCFSRFDTAVRPGIYAKYVGVHVETRNEQKRRSCMKICRSYGYKKARYRKTHLPEDLFSGLFGIDDPIAFVGVMSQVPE